MKNFLKNFFDIKFWKFLLVGVINTIVGECVVLLCLHPFGFKSYVWGAGAAAVVGTIVGSIVSYIMNKHFTFKNKEKGIKPMLRFTLNIVVCLILRVIAATAVSEGCKAAGLSMFGMDVNSFAANLMSKAPTHIMQYIISRRKSSARLHSTTVLKSEKYNDEGDTFY